ncbi:M14 family metallocarboxypeptidase [Aeribacillus composti]|uniref:M14 family metallocarboxypeptidase n=2 Tax=Aeribacillus composti TaxID=1868734 RepID=UPI002E226E6E|nr:M14 family metallocarboxypeptidase [Aeribacillus composti]
MTKRYFSIFLAFIMIFSLFFQPVLNDVYANKTDAVSLVSLKKDFVITDDTNQILGTISKDAEIFVKKTENGNYVFDWLGKEMELPQDQFELSESQLNYYNVNGENSSIVDFKSFKERVKVSDPTSNKIIAYIEPNQNIPFIEENENHLKVIIGNREGIITLKKTDQATDANTELPVQEKDVNNKESVPDFKNSEEINKQTEGTNNREHQQTSLAQNIKEKQLNNEILSFTKNIKYFKALEDLAVYVKRNGKLVKVGTLEKGQTYPRIRDYGNWHEIQFGKYKGYVHKNGTAAVLSPSIKNINKSYKISSYLLKITKNAQVYDNSSGKLVKFGEIYKGNEYPVIGDYGKWWRIDYLGRIGYIQKSQGELLFTANTKYFQVTRDNTPIYIKGKDKLVKVGMLEKGQTYPRIRDYGNWHEIQFGSKKGYIHKLSTVPAIKFGQKKVGQSKTNIGTFVALKNAVIYDNSGKKLVPFATISKNIEYPIEVPYGNWVKIHIANRVGYVHKSDVKVSLKKQAKPGNLVNPNQVYTYEEMVRDISELEKAYPNLISKRIIGQSVDGRNIYAVKLGKGKTEIMINGSHHAREYITTNLLMEMIDVYAYAYSKNLRVDGYPVRSILNNASIWFVPMVNPDGVTLVQKGHRSAKNPAYVLKLNGGSTNFAAWKANIRGVDLNRQYPADWYRIAGNTGRPSPQNYKGPRPLNEPEAKAMVNFTLSRNFKTAVSYHSSGEIIYWHFNTPKQHEVRDRKIASMIASKTGYRLVPPSNNPSGGGFTDWFISTQKKPAFTPEVAPYVGNRPVPISYFPSIWKKNQAIGIMLADEAYKNRNTR